jgi:hypothetical protein
MKTSYKSDELDKKKGGGPQIGYLWLLLWKSKHSKFGGMFSNCHIQLFTNVAIFIKKMCMLQ